MNQPVFFFGATHFAKKLISYTKKKRKELSNQAAGASQRDTGHRINQGNQSNFRVKNLKRITRLNHIQKLKVP